MKRVTNNKYNVSRLAAACLLAGSVLPCAVSASGFSAAYSMAGNSLSSFYWLGIELGAWEDYLLRELTSDLGVMEYLPEPRISWMAGEEQLLLPQFARKLLDEEPKTRLTFNYQSQIDTQLLAGNLNQRILARGDRPGFSLERTFLAPGIVHEISQNSLVGVSAILAYQRFSAPGLGYVAAADNDSFWTSDSQLEPFTESTYGTGVRLALRSELAPGMSIETAYQSRIDMEEFNQYRGVYSEPSDLDIPAKAELGLELKAGERSAVTLGIEHVLYSELNAFPTRFLPERFVSLLGDSSSPAFAWDDLTVFTVGWRWQQTENMEWWVDVTSRQQPKPTSATLSRALGNDLAENTMLVGFSKRTAANRWFNLTAAYAPPEYAFGGSVLGITSDELDQSLELEALWIWNF